MTHQWLRKCSLIVTDVANSGLDLSALHVNFRVTHSDNLTPNTLDIRIYNLTESTAKTIKEKYTRVILNAGYAENIGLIFDGQIIQVRTGRENATDTFVDITAADGDEALNWAVMNETLKAGWTQADVLAAIQKEMLPHGVTPGVVPTPEQAPALSGPRMSRAKVMFGPAREQLRLHSAATGTTASVDNGQLNLTAILAVLAGEAVELTFESGLIGMPTQTPDGVVVRSLLNPAIKRGGRIWINNASIIKAAFSTSYGTGAAAANSTWERQLADDGYYRVLVVDHEGDTRGNAWYSSMVCLGVGSDAPSGLYQRGVV